MKKLLLPFVALLLLSSHDLFLKPDGYFLPPAKRVSVRLFNGTYDASENVIDRNRMIDVSRVDGGTRTPIDTSDWYEQDSATILDFTTWSAGTVVIGVSTRPRNIEMDAAAFNRYLEHDGILDEIDRRTEREELDDPAVERYSKHVKTLLQVGKERSEDYRTVLDYPIEFVPQLNPYDLTAGDELPVLLLRDGAPLAGQLVYAAAHEAEHGHSHADGEAHTHTGEGITQLRTDNAGMIRVPLTREGNWYLRTIHLVPSPEEDLTHESNWATLTFAVGHAHGAGTHVHDDPVHIHGYVWWLGSLALIAGLFVYFNRANGDD